MVNHSAFVYLFPLKFEILFTSLPVEVLEKVFDILFLAGRLVVSDKGVFPHVEAEHWSKASQVAEVLLVDPGV